MSIWEMSLHGGVIIVAVLLLRRFALDRLPKKVFAALWELAMFRLVIPLSLSSKSSVYNLLALFNKQSEPIKQSETVLSEIPKIHLNNSAGFYSDILPAAAEQAKEVPIWLIIYLFGAALCLVFFPSPILCCCEALGFLCPVKINMSKRRLISFAYEEGLIFAYANQYHRL